MLAQKKHFVSKFEKPSDCVALCTGATHSMVKAYAKQADGDAIMSTNEAPDYGDDGDDLSLTDWGLPRWETIEENLRETSKKDNIHPVDVTSIVSKSNPMPVKELGPFWFEYISKDGVYCGHNDIIKALKQDVFRTMIAGRPQTVSRWAMNMISEDLRNDDNANEADLRAQFDKVHGGATIKSGIKLLFPHRIC